MLKRPNTWPTWDIQVKSLAMGASWATSLQIEDHLQPNFHFFSLILQLSKTSILIPPNFSIVNLLCLILWIHPIAPISSSSWLIPIPNDLQEPELISNYAQNHHFCINYAQLQTFFLQITLFYIIRKKFPQIYYNLSRLKA